MAPESRVDVALVSPGVSGDYQYPESVSRVFEGMVERLQLPPIRLHDLRHTWATLAMQTDGRCEKSLAASTQVRGSTWCPRGDLNTDDACIGG